MRGVAGKRFNELVRGCYYKFDTASEIRIVARRDAPRVPRRAFFDLWGQG
jgi:hypothetical protein